MKSLSVIWRAAALILFISILFPICGLAQYGSTVREDRTWEYKRVKFNNALLEEESITNGYHFKGTEEVNGILYAVFRDPDSVKIALMRQEESRVYLLLEDATCTDAESGKPVSGEVLLYDFSLKSGNIFKCAGFDDRGLFDALLVECRMMDSYEVTYDGDPIICQKFQFADGSYPEDTFMAIEEVGNLVGLLSFPQFGNYTSGNWILYYVKTVRDSKGNVIYGNLENGVTTPADYVDDAGDGELYDIFGRKVRDPIRGSIYIQAGRKIIWQ